MTRKRRSIGSRNITIMAMFAVLLLVVGCRQAKLPSFKEIPKRRSPLINGFMSYQSVASVERQLKARGFRWRVSTDKSATDRSGPQHVTSKVTVDDYTDLDVQGKMQAVFVNDRLSYTRFFPASFNDYLRKLRSQVRLKRLESGDLEGMIPPFSRVRATNKRGRRAVVVFEDTRLFKEDVIWAEYSGD